MADQINKIFTNSEIPDIPFPEIPPHDHNGSNSPLLAPSSIDSLQIKAGAVVTESLADNSVGSDKIIADAILTEHINALAVTQQKLADAAVATAKIQNGAVNASKLIQSEAVITLSAQIASAVIISAHIGTGVIQNAHLANAIISTAKIIDGAIVNAKIGNAEITSAKIGNAEVKNGNIENLAVTTAKIDELAVEWSKIGSLAVGNSKIMDAAISTAKIQDEAVGTAQITNAAITNAKIDNLAVTDAKIASLTAGKITAGQFNLTSAGYLSCPYGGIKIGYLRNIGGVSIYGIQAGAGHGLMLDDGANGYARMWIDTSGNRPLCIDTTVNDRIFFKASSGNDIMRLYGTNAWAGGHVDIMTSLRLGSAQPSNPVSGQMYYEPNPSGMGTGGRLMIYNGYAWHAAAWFDEI